MGNIITLKSHLHSHDWPGWRGVPSGRCSASAAGVRCSSWTPRWRGRYRRRAAPPWPATSRHAARPDGSRQDPYRPRLTRTGRLTNHIILYGNDTTKLGIINERKRLIQAHEGTIHIREFGEGGLSQRLWETLNHQYYEGSVFLNKAKPLILIEVIQRGYTWPERRKVSWMRNTHHRSRDTSFRV